MDVTPMDANRNARADTSSGDPADMDDETHRAARNQVPTPQLGTVDSEGVDALGRLLLGSESVASVLHRAASYAQRTLPVAEEASVTLTTGPRRASAAWTGLMAFELDECQYGLGYGPCLEAAVTGRAVVISDTATETRWPAFAELAARQGVASTLSVPIPVGDSAQAALNLYSTSTAAFDDPLLVSKAMHTAGQAAAAIANMHDLDRARTEIANLQLALESRAGIEQAKGILMAIHGYDADKAFEVLSHRSQNSNRKLRDIAAEMIDQVVREQPAPGAGTDRA
ncbi:GAF-ANTAR transcription anti-termination regulator [Klenkia terrae]|nr:GAF-ANTAR transcription anti-termination regulator [Klenkia terrae]